jgi:hypothetical protein
MRTRKIRGEDSLFNSISMAERDEGGAGGIADDFRCWGPVFGPQYGTAVAGKKPPSHSIPPGDPARDETGSGPASYLVWIIICFAAIGF